MVPRQLESAVQSEESWDSAAALFILKTLGEFNFHRSKKQILPSQAGTVFILFASYPYTSNSPKAVVNNHTWDQSSWHWSGSQYNPINSIPVRLVLLSQYMHFFRTRWNIPLRCLKVQLYYTILNWLIFKLISAFSSFIACERAISKICSTSLPEIIRTALQEGQPCIL